MADKPYIIVDETEALDENGIIKEGYEQRAYVYVKLIPVAVDASEQKRQAYKAEADPIHKEYKALLDLEHPDAEIRHQEWLAKRAEIAARFE